MIRKLVSFGLALAFGTVVIIGCGASGVVTTSSGLKYVDIVKGTGDMPHAGDQVTVNYTGRLTDSTIFDSNMLPEFGHVEPFTFPIGVGRVIQGWDEGVMTMHVGGKRKLIIPPSLAYKDRAVGDKIKPNSTLVFDVELLKIEPK